MQGAKTMIHIPWRSRLALKIHDLKEKEKERRKKKPLEKIEPRYDLHKNVEVEQILIAASVVLNPPREKPGMSLALIFREIFLSPNDMTTIDVVAHIIESDIKLRHSLGVQHIGWIPSDIERIGRRVIDYLPHRLNNHTLYSFDEDEILVTLTHIMNADKLIRIALGHIVENGGLQYSIEDVVRIANTSTSYLYPHDINERRVISASNSVTDDKKAAEAEENTEVGSPAERTFKVVSDALGEHENAAMKAISAALDNDPNDEDALNAYNKLSSKNKIKLAEIT
jgi:hypothetical protein